MTDDDHLVAKLKGYVSSQPRFPALQAESLPFEPPDMSFLLKVTVSYTHFLLFILLCFLLR